MKNQYFGDINDYQKFGILRAVADASLRTMVCWMLTRDDKKTDERRDGLRLSYLDKPDIWTSSHHSQEEPGLTPNPVLVKQGSISTLDDTLRAVAP